MLEEIIQPLSTTRPPLVSILAQQAAPAREKPQPVKVGAGNPLRPTTLDTMIGQARLRGMLRRVIDNALITSAPLDHMLLVGASGTGKSTIAGIVANELAVDVYQVEAPISHETLLDLRDVMNDGDVLFIDEIHQQAIMERRGKVSTTQPEVLFNVMEDRTIVSGSGVLDFPKITLVGATTDEGMLPDPFINRFPLRPVIAPYGPSDLTQMAVHNATALACVIDTDAAELLAGAARLTPRVVNNYVRNASSLAPCGHIDLSIAEEVLYDLNGVTKDGLTTDMQNMLRFMYSRCKSTTKSGEVTYKASVSSIATAIGKARDQKAVQLRVEPYLIMAGYVQVGHAGRLLTDEGIKRARQLMTSK